MYGNIWGVTGGAEKGNGSTTVNYGVENREADGNTFFNASLGGAKPSSSSKTSVTGTAQLSTDWGNNDNDGRGQTVLGTDHSIVSTSSSTRFAPVGVGAIHLSEDANTRVGAFFVPYNLEIDNASGTRGSSAGIHLLGDINVRNIALISANLRAGATYKMKGDVQLNTSSINYNQCANGTANVTDPSTQSTSTTTTQTCTNSTTVTKYQTQPGFEQQGIGSYAQFDLSGRVRIGENGYIGAYMTWEKQNKKGTFTDYVTGPEAGTGTLSSSKVGVGASIGVIF